MCPLCYLTARALSFFAQKLNPEISGLNYNPHPHHNTASTGGIGGFRGPLGSHWVANTADVPCGCVYVGVGRSALEQTSTRPHAE